MGYDQPFMRRLCLLWTSVALALLAAPGSAKGLSAGNLKFEKTLVKSKRKLSGPKIRKLPTIKAAHYYEVYGLNGHKQFRRYRGWFFRTKKRTFGVRVRDLEDFGEEPDPELLAFLGGLTPRN